MVELPLDRVQTLAYTVVAVLRASSEKELTYAHFAGYAMVQQVDTFAGSVNMLLPSSSSTATNFPSYNPGNSLTYFVVPGDIKGMTFAGLSANASTH